MRTASNESVISLRNPIIAPIKATTTRLDANHGSRWFGRWFC